MISRISLFVLSLALAASLPAQWTGPQQTLVSGTTDTRFGAHLAGAGDLNADGFPDFWVGEPLGHSAAGNGTGRVVAYSGRDLSQLLVVSPVTTTLGFGEDFDGIGDVTGDGIADLVVAGVSVPGLVGALHGAAVFSGANGGFVRGLGAPSGFGPTVSSHAAGLGDLDGDGVGEIFLGRPTNSTGIAGSFEIYSGATGQVVGTVAGSSFGASNAFGAVASSLGDLDADGVSDFAVGDAGQGVAGPFSAEGRVYVFSGATRQVLHTHTGLAPGERVGASVSGLGEDLSGDGVPDYVVGVPSTGIFGPPCGARILSGANGAVLVTYLGPQDEQIGERVCAAGDRDGDGRGDIALASHFANFGGGRIDIVSSATGLLIDTLSDALAAPSLPRFGRGLAALDGAGDDLTAVGFLAGAPYLPPFNAGPCYLQIFAAHPSSPLPGSADDLVMTSARNGDEPGRSHHRLQAGDLLQLVVRSPAGTLTGLPVSVVAQPYLPPQFIPAITAFPDAHVNPNVPGFIYAFGDPNLGLSLLPANDVLLAFTTPPGLTGFRIRLQAGVINPAAANGFFSLTHGHEVRL